jgi:hypothetical protein
MTQTPSLTPDGGCETQPEKPVLASPKDKAKVKSKRPTLKWYATACASSYKVVVKDAATGVVVDKKGGLTGLEYKTDSLTSGKTYKWFVQACNPPFGCAKSAARTFTVQ